MHMKCHLYTCGCTCVGVEVCVCERERDLEAECCQISWCLIPQVPDVLKRYQAEVVHWSEGGVGPETIPVRVIHTRHRLCVWNYNKIIHSPLTINLLNTDIMLHVHVLPCTNWEHTRLVQTVQITGIHMIHTEFLSQFYCSLPACSWRGPGQLSWTPAYWLCLPSRVAIPRQQLELASK